MDTRDAETVMRPFSVCCLGWFCLGYHLSDAPGRAATIQGFLLHARIVTADIATIANVRIVLQRLLTTAPEWVTLSQLPTASLVALSLPCRAVGSALVAHPGPWIPYAADPVCTCGRDLVRWRVGSAVVFTLASGMLRGTVVYLRCFSCKAVYAGNWRWDNVPESCPWPDGFHSPRCVHSGHADKRWFFATPQVVWEISLLHWLLGCVARGGMTHTAIFVVYNRLWSHTMTGTMYAERSHFVNKLCVVMLVWGTLCLIRGSGVSLHDFVWYLRPHHTASDFAALVSKTNEAFDAIARAHDCALFKKVRAVIVDGKWCIQTSICNQRGAGATYSSALQSGYFKGCVRRPAPGAFFCADHAAQCTLAPEECHVTAHREAVISSNISLQYCFNKVWCSEADVPVEQIRAYEMSLLRKRRGGSATEATCNKDPKKDVAETVVSGRKSAGILIAVTPCLQIVSVKPMYGAESVTQVLFMVLGLLVVLSDLSYVLYDNACSVVRHLRKQHSDRVKRDCDASAWAILLALRWIIDRLHWTYHRACEDPASGYFVPGVSPHDYPELVGVDTEAAEQVFHIANRWQIVLSNAAPVHQELFLLVFAHDHNTHHSCTEAWLTYTAAQKSASRAQDDVAAEAPGVVAGGEAVLCSPCVPVSRSKRRKVVSSSCAGPPELLLMGALSHDGVSGTVDAPSPLPDAHAEVADAAETSAPSTLPLDSTASLMDQLVAVNERSNGAVIHAVQVRGQVYSKCGWSFQGRSRVMPFANLARRRGLVTCGLCFDTRSMHEPVAAQTLEP
jgi:hypothetical protein